MAGCALIDGRRGGLPFIAIGLIVALIGLTIGVHEHGLVTVFDGAVTARIDHWAQRSHRLRGAAAAVNHFGNPAAIALAAVSSGGLLSVYYRSVVPGVVVVMTTGSAVLIKDVMATVIDRPVAEAELLISPILAGEPHPFPSGHVAGTAALLGIVAVGIGAHAGLWLRALLAAGVAAGTLMVAVSRLVLHAHWLADVVGGALLAGIVVSLGSAILVSTSGGRTRGRRTPTQRDVGQMRRLRA